jgi:hypothetical protein
MFRCHQRSSQDKEPHRCLAKLEMYHRFDERHGSPRV